MSKHILVLLSSVLFFMSSCKTTEKANDLNYLQNAEDIALAAAQNSAPSTIQPADQLSIYVSAKNMDVVKPFNQNYYSSQNSITPNAAQNASTLEKIYVVSSSGTIDFPVLGEISTTLKTVEQIKDELTERISAYVKNPTVTVRLTNFKVTVLGEVMRPGLYTLTDINPTILNALGLAGDLTMYGKRDNILIVRNVNGESTKERINLMDTSFISSPFYYLKQGDVIYVSANQTKQKTSRLDPNTPIYISVAGIAVTILALVFSK